MTTTTTIETLILRNLLYDKTYTVKILPYLKGDYFTTTANKKLFKIIKAFIDRYNSSPNVDVLEVIINESKIDESTYNECIETLGTINEPDDSDRQWLLDQTEQYCKDRAIYLAIMESISILDDENSKLTKEAIPKLLQDALSVSFDPSIGHDYVDDAESRYDYYHQEVDRMPFDIDYLNKVTGNGIEKGTLTILMAPTGVGKTFVKCHFASSFLMAGKNVLYISLEMSEERIAQRIDANLLDVTIDKIASLSKDKFTNSVLDLKKKSSGNLIIKQYPTSTAHAGHFRTLLNELKFKRGIVPDVVFFDYLNICISSRYNAATSNSYTYIKSIAEEIRGLAVEFNFAAISSTQVNRDGYNNSDFDLTNTSESIGLPMTVDYMFALIETDELKQMNQIMFKQLKNRYGDISYMNKFVVGADKAKMKLYNLGDLAQDDIVRPSSSKSDFMSNKPDFGRIQLS